MESVNILPELSCKLVRFILHFCEMLMAGFRSLSSLSFESVIKIQFAAIVNFCLFVVVWEVFTVPVFKWHILVLLLQRMCLHFVGLSNLLGCF